MSSLSCIAGYRQVAALLAVLLLVAQVGQAMHSLHLDRPGADSVCAFCTGVTHLGAAPGCSVLALLHGRLLEPPPATLESLPSADLWAANRARAPPR